MQERPEERVIDEIANLYKTLGPGDHITMNHTQAESLVMEFEKEKKASAYLAAEKMTLNKEIEELEESVDQAYSERNKLVSILGQILSTYDTWEVYRTEHDPEDTSWDSVWRHILVMENKEANLQASWHFPVDELELLDGYPHKDWKWDGHTTEEKYSKLQRYFKE